MPESERMIPVDHLMPGMQNIIPVTKRKVLYSSVNDALGSEVDCLAQRTMPM
jgi:hypothetical protein